MNTSIQIQEHYSNFTEAFDILCVDTLNLFEKINCKYVCIIKLKIYSDENKKTFI